MSQLKFAESLLDHATYFLLSDNIVKQATHSSGHEKLKIFTISATEDLQNIVNQLQQTGESLLPTSGLIFHFVSCVIDSLASVRWSDKGLNISQKIMIES